MNPDLDLRLKSVLKALSDVILPALPASERLARDQANLVIGHLSIIAEHWQYALKFELENLALACALAGELAGLNFEATLGDELIVTLAAAEDVDRSDYAAVTAIHRTLKLIIDRLIATQQHAAPMPREMIDAVLRYNQRRATRERVWHRAAGLDPDAASLPPITSLFERQARWPLTSL
jgi:hypothetical protein